MSKAHQIPLSDADGMDLKLLGRIAWVAGAVVAVVGLVVLAGWVFGVLPLKSVVPGWAKMSAITALAFVSSGIALWCLAERERRKAFHRDEPQSLLLLRAAHIGALCAASLGVVKLADFYLGLNLHVDTLGFPDEVSPGIAPAQMAPATALNFLLAACSILLADRARRPALFHTLVLLIGLNGCLGLFRYVCGGEPWLPFQFMAVHTAINFVILSAGILCLHPRGGLIAWMLDDRTSRRISWPIGLVLAASLSGITLLVRISIGSGLDGASLIIFTIPIILSAYWGGFLTGLMATLLSSLGAVFLVLEPKFAVQISSSSNRWQVGVLIFSGTLISVISMLLHRARDQADAMIEQIRDGEERLHAVTDNLAEGLVICDLEEHLLHWNRAGLRMHGFTDLAEGMRRLPEFTELFQLSLLDGTPLSLDQWPMSRILRREPVSALDIRIHRTDAGWTKVFRYSGAIVQDAAGKPVAFVSIEDITDRMRSDSELRESQHLLEQAQQVAHVGSWWSDINMSNGKLHWSKETHRICGIPEDQFDHRLETFFNLVHPDDRERVLQASIAASHQGKTYAVDHRLIRPDGQIIWVHERADILRDSEGKPLRMVGICQDITEQHRADQALRDSEQRYRAIVEDQTEFITRCTPDGIRTFVNTAYAKYHGMPPHEMLGTSFLPYVVEEDRVEVLAKFARLTPDHPVETDEHRVLLPDGRLVWHSWSDRGVFDEQGRLREIQSVGRDITERKRTESRFRRVVDSNAQGIIFWNIQGQIIGANDAFLAMVGYTRGDLESGRLNWIALTPPEFAYLDARALEEIALAKICTPFEKEYIRNDGSRVPILLGAATFEDNPQEGFSFVLDISARKMAEAAQHRLTETQSAILNALPAHIALLDSQGVIVSVNEAWRRFAIAGAMQGPEFDLGENYLTVCQNSTGDGAEEAIEAAKGIDRVLQGLQNEFILEYPCHSPTRQQWFRLIVTPVHEEHQSGAVIMHIDITDRKLAEIAKAQLAAIVESSIEAIIGKDLSGAVTSWNLGAEHIFGYNAKEMICSSITRLIPSDRTDEEPMILAKIIQGGTLEHFETKRQTKDGRLIDVSITLSPIRDAGGNIIGISQVARDITEKKLAAALVEEWRNRYEAAIHASRQIMYDWNTKTDVITVAGATERLIGCQPEDLSTLERWKARVHPDDLPAFLEQVERVKQTYDRFLLEYRVRKGDGTYLEMEDHGFYFVDATGDRTRMVGFLSDITARKEAERERRKLEMKLSHKQKMEAVGNLASGIAHDFSNILTAIQGHLSLAYRGLLPDHPAHKSLRIVEQAAQQGVDMTRSITAFARKTPLEKEPCSLVEITTDFLRLFRHLLPQTIEIDYQPQTDHAPWILAARSQIQQVIMNLILNARDAMPTGGKLSVRIGVMSKAAAHMVPLLSHQPPRKSDTAPTTDCGTLSRDDSIAVLSVTDTGCGMNDQTMARIFEPFFTTKERQQGSGLGMAMVHGIVTEHQGWVAVESAPDDGARFDVFIPMCAPLPPKPASTAPTARIPAHRPRFVLVLHPDNFVGEIMTTSLESAGYVVVMVRDADDLIDQLGAHGSEVGAIVVDADVLPESDEPPVFALHKELLDTPLVVISSNMAQFLDEPLAAKLTILPKPFQMSKLISLVDRAVGVIPAGAK